MTRDKVHLLYIQQTIQKITRLTAKGKTIFLQDDDEQAAILYYLQTLSESTTRLSDELKEKQPQIAWQQIRGLRNRVAHDYLSIDLELVWLIITTELTALSESIEQMLNILEKQSTDDGE
ncbi:MAG: HepT-like ribonuclease domain-containing protein [Phototrophicaceae bacterium]